MSKQKKSLSLVLIIFLSIISVSALAATSILISNWSKDKGENNTTSAGNQENGSKQGDGGSDENGSSPASIKYSGRATVDTENKTIKLHFENPCRSQRSISLKLVSVINNVEVPLGEKDILKPCDSIDSLDYSSPTVIEKGYYKGKYILHFINDAGEEELVNTEVLIDVTIE